MQMDIIVKQLHIPFGIYFALKILWGIHFNEQIFFAKDYQKRINSPIITTGNELVKEQIGDFSKQLNINELYQYILDVDKSTTEILKLLSYESMRVKMTEEKREAH